MEELKERLARIDKAINNWKQIDTDLAIKNVKELKILRKQTVEEIAFYF